MNDWLFKALASELNPDVEVIGNYINSRTKIRVRCKKCNEEYDSTHTDILCGKLHTTHNHSKWCSTWLHNTSERERIEKKLRYINSKGIVALSYNPANTSITLRCTKCGSVYIKSIFEHSIYCENCKNVEMVTGASYGYSSHLQELLNNSKDIDLCTKNKSVLNCHCKKCNSDFNVVGYMKRRKITCPICTKNNRTEQKAAQRYAQLNSQYTSMRRKCDYFNYCTRTNDYLCEKCLMLSDKYYTKSEFKGISENANRNISILGEYVNSTTKIKYQCKTCGNVYEAKPNSLINGSCRCKKCQCSNGERKVSAFLDDNNIIYHREYMFKDCIHIRPLRFDFFVPSMQVAIEYDGMQHFEPVDFFNKNNSLKDIKYRDKIKNDFCRKNGIRLIRIPYTCKNIDKFLSDMLNVTITN